MFQILEILKLEVTNSPCEVWLPYFLKTLFDKTISNVYAKYSLLVKR